MVKIFIIDKDLSSGDFLRLFLTKKGYEVKYSCDVKGGEDKIKKFKPDIVFLDYGMKDIVKDIKGIIPGIHIIMMADGRNPVHSEDAIVSGVEEFVYKPFSLADLENNVLPEVLRRLN